MLGSVGHVRVLRALASDRVPQSAPQLAAAAGLTPQGTRGVLDVLARQRLVKIHGSGRTQLYELNAAHPLASPLAAPLAAHAQACHRGAATGEPQACSTTSKVDGMRS